MRYTIRIARLAPHERHEHIVRHAMHEYFHECEGLEGRIVSVQIYGRKAIVTLDGDPAIARAYDQHTLEHLFYH